MSDELISRLRYSALKLRSWSEMILDAPATEVTGSQSLLYEEAAAEIERLREALDRIAHVDEMDLCNCPEGCGCGMVEARRIAEEALKVTE